MAKPAVDVVMVAHACPAAVVTVAPATPHMVPATTGTVTVVPVPFQLPRVVANTTLAMGLGALTRTTSESPICIEAAVGFGIAALAGATLLGISVDWLMPKVEAADVTLIGAVAVWPTAVATTLPEIAPVVIFLT